MDNEIKKEEVISQSMKDALLNYLDNDLTVIPIRGRYANTLSEAKRPLVKWERWQGQKPNWETAELWMSQKPLMDVGLLTGPTNGILALDVDGQKGYQSIADKPLPDTWINVTRRGEHYVYLWDKRLDSIATTVVGILPGIDVRGKGGYICAPPSVGVGDFQYKWKEGYSPADRKLAPPPEWLVQLLLANSAKEEYQEIPEEEGWLNKLRGGVSEGENRHKAMTRLASFYMSRGLPEDDVMTIMLAWNQKCTPPKDEREFTDKLDQFLENWRSGRYKSTYKEPATKFEVKKSADFMNGGDTKIDWLVRDIIPQGTIGFLHGYGGQGKSWLSLDLAIEIGRGGGRWLDRYATTGGKVLYIDQESGDRLLRTRYNKLLNGKGLTPSEVDVTFMSMQGLLLDNMETLDAFKGLLANIKPDLAIFDPFISLHTMNENSQTDMAKLRAIFKGIVKDIGTGLFFLDHETKPKDEPVQAQYRQRGSSEKQAVADWMLAVSNNTKLGDAKGFKLMIEQSKARHDVAIDPFMIECRDIDEVRSSILFRGAADFDDIR